LFAFFLSVLKKHDIHLVFSVSLCKLKNRVRQDSRFLIGTEKIQQTDLI